MKYSKYFYVGSGKVVRTGIWSQDLRGANRKPPDHPAKLNKWHITQDPTLYPSNISEHWEDVTQVNLTKRQGGYINKEKSLQYEYLSLNSNSK